MGILEFLCSPTVSSYGKKEKEKGIWEDRKKQTKGKGWLDAEKHQTER